MKITKQPPIIWPLKKRHTNIHNESEKSVCVMPIWVHELRTVGWLTNIHTLKLSNGYIKSRSLSMAIRNSDSAELSSSSQTTMLINIPMLKSKIHSFCYLFAVFLFFKKRKCGAHVYGLLLSRIVFENLCTLAEFSVKDGERAYLLERYLM